MTDLLHGAMGVVAAGAIALGAIMLLAALYHFIREIVGRGR